jgi:helicase MOV-10
MAGKLTNYGIKPGHFNVVFIDEAGHATEPETIGSFAGLLNKDDGQLVLAGDPMQLGPIIRSKIAIKGKLNISLLERFMKGETSKLYDKNIDKFPETDGFDQRFVTKLRECYRCHPEILKVPNDLFYDGELLSAADPIISHGLLGTIIVFTYFTLHLIDLL